MSGEQFGVLIHGRWLETEKPQATVIRSDDGWTWQEVCTTDPETATEVAEALHQAALRRNDTYDEALADQLARALRSCIHDRPTAHTDEVWQRIHRALEAHEEARRER